MQWDSKIGPATIVGIAQLLLILIGGVVTVTQLQSSIETEKLQVTELKNVVTTLQAAQASGTERVGRLETSIGFLNTSVNRIETKIDEKTSPRR